MNLTIETEYVTMAHNSLAVTPDTFNRNMASQNIVMQMRKGHSAIGFRIIFFGIIMSLILCFYLCVFDWYICSIDGCIVTKVIYIFCTNLDF